MIIGIEKGMRSRKYADAAKKMGISYKFIDCTKNDAIDKIKKIDALIWHWTQDKPGDKRAAPYIIRCAEIMGKAVYPNIDTCWMFDDKIAEKYLLESVDAPLIDTFVFYDEQSAIMWLRKQAYPVVYKLPQGAGSNNVRLVHSVKEGEEICKAHFKVWGDPALNMRLYYNEKKGCIKTLFDNARDHRILYGVNNKGNIMFQKYLPNNRYDIRVTVIGEKCVIFRRWVRDNDFRASGSGKIDYNVSDRDLKAIPIACSIAKKINSQSMAFDFLYDDGGELKINEISYGFSARAVYEAGGWYDMQLCYHDERVDIHEFVLNAIKAKLEEKTGV